MTQLLFEFAPAASADTPTVLCTPSSPHPNRRQPVRRDDPGFRQTESGRVRQSNRVQANHSETDDRSVALYAPGDGQIQHVGDLAQLVIARYDIVRRRREARLAREAAKRARGEAVRRLVMAY